MPNLRVIFARIFARGKQQGLFGKEKKLHYVYCAFQFFFYLICSESLFSGPIHNLKSFIFLLCIPNVLDFLSSLDY